MQRQKTPRSPTAVSLSGPLSHALPRHAEQRARHLFLFLFYLRATCNVIGDATGRRFRPADLVREAAPHQIDSGLRGSAPRDAFDPADPGVIHQNATSFSRIDAAHYCNLGLDRDFDALEGAAARHPVALELIGSCKVIAGNTVWMPQPINLGPDRVVDRLHYELAVAFLEEAEPVFKPEHVDTYAKRVDTALRDYASGKDRSGDAGLAACARCYLAPYSNLAAAIGDTLRGNISAECKAYDLDPGRYVGD